MTNITPPARTNALHTAAGITPAAAEATALAAGNTIVFQNNGNTICRIQAGVAGTGTVVALNAANNQAVTIATPETLVGPLDPAVFGQTVTITTATATGTVALYQVPPRYANGLRNPFETNAAAVDAI